MKEYIKMGLSIFGKMILINIMCLFLVISMTVLTDAMFTQAIGYTVFVTDNETNELVEQYEHFYADGEDTRTKEIDEEKYNVQKSVIKSKLSKTADMVFYVVTQAICLTLVFIFIYPKLWERGSKDSNLVSFGHLKEDKLKGLKAGVISVIPPVLFTAALLVLKPYMLKEFPVAVIKFVYSWSYSFNALVCGDATKLGDLSFGALVGLLLFNLFIVAVAGVSYYLGYKHIAVAERLVYEKEDIK